MRTEDEIPLFEIFNSKENFCYIVNGIHRVECGICAGMSITLEVKIEVDVDFLEHVFNW